MNVKSLKNNFFWQSFSFVLTRAFVFYLFVFFLSTGVIDYKKIKFNAQINILNNIMPQSFSYMVRLAQDPTKINVNELVRYIVFYERVIKFFPDSPEALSMLGFSYCLLGNYKLAVQFYQEAIEYNPDVFWFYYNLGVVYFKTGQLKKVVEVLDKAVNQDPQNTIKFIVDSKFVYKSILIDKDAGDFTKQTTQRLARGYRDSYKISVISYYRLKDYENMLLAARKGLAANLGEESFFNYYAGLASYEKKDYPQAVHFLKQSILKGSDYPEPYQYLILSLKAIGNDDEAKKFEQMSADIKNPKGINDGTITVQMF